MSELVNLKERIIGWNIKAGNKPPKELDMNGWLRLNNQSRLLVEEAKEALDGTENCDPKELLDGICDTFVIWSYLVEQAESLGFDVEGALEAICDNNDTKILDNYEDACNNLGIQLALDEWSVIDETSYNGAEFFTVKNGKGKIMKPKGFKAVDLSKFLPKDKEI